jgi:hypothetical protein
MMIRKLASIAALGLAASFGAHATDIALDGYCNTFSLNTSGAQVYGTRSGCGYTVIDGGAVAKVGNARQVVTSDTNDQAEIFTWYFSLPSGGAGTWQLYWTDGTQSVLFNSGTYTVTTASTTHQLQRGGVDVTAR